MKVIVTGASGVAGKSVLLECLDYNDISEVLFIGRKSLEMNHLKLKELIQRDYSEFDSVKGELNGYDTCSQCMGVSSVSFSKEDYFK